VLQLALAKVPCERNQPQRLTTLCSSIPVPQDFQALALALHHILCGICFVDGYASGRCYITWLPTVIHEALPKTSQFFDALDSALIKELEGKLGKLVIMCLIFEVGKRLVHEIFRIKARAEKCFHRAGRRWPDVGTTCLRILTALRNLNDRDSLSRSLRVNKFS
jgi:hypothetical protein